uniref:Uncharacterized protein n=1 Tax=Octopus bimaculoides TaxID=37653 RepID=A0A0L8HLW6_OCTBM
MKRGRKRRKVKKRYLEVGGMIKGVRGRGKRASLFILHSGRRQDEKQGGKDEEEREEKKSVSVSGRWENVMKVGRKRSQCGRKIMRKRGEIDNI